MEDQMIFWLVMYISAGTSAAMLHVGNYRKMDDCLAAAHRVQYPTSPPIVPQYACIQANDAGAQPPPG
jgi:hypothetical protein